MGTSEMFPSDIVAAVGSGFLLCVKRGQGSGSPRKQFRSRGQEQCLMSGRCNVAFNTVTCTLGFLQGLDSPRLPIDHRY